MTIESLMHGYRDKTTETDEFNDRGEPEPRPIRRGAGQVAGLCRIREVPHIGVKASIMGSGWKARPVSKSNRDVVRSLG